MAWSPQFVDNLCWRLKALGAPKVLVFATLLTIWTDIPESSWQDNSVFSFVETFAGEAQATMAFRSSDFRSARLDLKYMSAEADRCNPMDLCTPPGFATALAIILRGDVDKGWWNHYGLKCASWTAVNSGTSGRSPCSSIGNIEHASVREANCLGSRMLLLMMVAVCLNAVITLEQPFSSFFEFYPRFRDFIRMLQHTGGPHAVHKTSWYMLHYGGPTPKRHYAFANTHHIDKLNLGQLRGWLQKKEALKELGQTYDLVDKYVDASGQPRWKGNKRLRSSECYPQKFGQKLVEMFYLMIKEKRGMPELPEHVPSAAETFASMSFDDMWQEAFMSDVCHYLRGGVYLKVPPSFSGLLPKRL
ncbi:unnamed protein product [Cladocopium goreaui]|uniref:Uncharacterized protein n=1 Tax=Cladocopium goreaui TaxID=2562237 RepID=A0A9P1G6G5_9DINO|nr:unnamed protein product [Cladocopium goreaui]